MYETDELLKSIRRVHFIGIGGSGMCPLAEILHKEGYIVSGSDNNDGDTLDRIRSLGISVFMGQNAKNIRGAEMIIYTAALLPDNPELVAAKQSGIPTFERSKLFGAITRMHSNCIGVSGTHGKTTVTSILSQIMITAGADPTCVIGGKLPLIGSNGRAGHSELMICEACEFVDTFLDLSPDTVIITNIDEDHLDYFKTVENLTASFRKFALLASKRVIYNAGDEKTLKAVAGITDKEMISFGLSPDCDYSARNITSDHAVPSFDVYNKDALLGRLELSIPGSHNILNALAAVAAAHINGVRFSVISSASKDFRGAGRRFEILGKRNGVTIADDYAHHPKEIEVTLTAAKQMGFARVWAVFQPFTFSRTAMLIDEFAKALKIADKVVMTEIMGSREINTYGVHTSQLAKKIDGSVWFATFADVARHIAENAREGDLVITLGCGDIYKAAREILKKYDIAEV